MVDFPAGVHPVLVVLPVRDGVHGHVGAHELTVDVAADVGLDEVLVQQAVEHLGLRERAAGDLNPAEQRVPVLLGRGFDRVEVPTRVLALPVERGVRIADVGDAQLRLDGLCRGRVEREVDRRRPAGSGDHLRSGERLVEGDVEMHRVGLRLAVVGALAAEVAARLGPGDLVVADDRRGARRELAVLGIPELDQEAGLCRGGIGESRHRAVGCRGELRGDRVRLVGLGRVIAGLGHLVRVAEGAEHAVRVTAGERAGQGSIGTSSPAPQPGPLTWVNEYPVIDVSPKL